MFFRARHDGGGAPAPARTVTTATCGPAGGRGTRVAPSGPRGRRPVIFRVLLYLLLMLGLAVRERVVRAR